MILTLSVFMVLGMAGVASAAIMEISPLGVYEMMEDDYIGYLIDIRTPEEWSGGDYWDPRPGEWKNTDGHPGYDGVNGVFLEGRVLNISSHLFSDTGRDPNPWFEWEFLNRYAFVTDEPFALICASGKRSYNAADNLDALASSLGLNWHIYNVVGGFKGRSEGPDDYCFGHFCNDGHCAGWKESWEGFPEGLPRIDLEEYPCEGAYSPVPIPGALFLLGSGIVGILGILRKTHPSKISCIH